MTPEELDVNLEELEVRLERLRALYEQYFLGFEKIEPSVARKDVDRRIYVLRREKIRNTGKRFKLQTIIQRYNTFQQYWQRICREIENGTYKRHLLKAERQLAPGGQLTIAARRRFGKLIAAGAGEGITNAAEAEAEPGGGARQSTRPSSLPPESADLITRRPPPAPASDGPAFGSEAPTEVAPRRAPPPKPERARPLSTPPDPNAAGKFDSLELDMGFLGSWVPPAPGAPPAPAAKPAPPPKPAIPQALPIERPAKPEPQPARPPGAADSPPKLKAPPAKPRPAPSPDVSPPAAGLSDERVRALHEKLIAMKRENKEAGQVSFENLSRSLRETENKLRAQHKDRKIDFDVVIRDGKAIVKPTVK